MHEGDTWHPCFVWIRFRNGVPCRLADVSTRIPYRQLLFHFELHFGLNHSFSSSLGRMIHTQFIVIVTDRLAFNIQLAHPLRFRCYEAHAIVCACDPNANSLLWNTFQTKTGTKEHSIVQLVRFRPTLAYILYATFAPELSFLQLLLLYIFSQGRH